MSRKKKERERGEKNAIYSRHLRLCQQPRATHALRSDQNCCSDWSWRDNTNWLITGRGCWTVNKFGFDTVIIGDVAVPT